MAMTWLSAQWAESLAILLRRACRAITLQNSSPEHLKWAKEWRPAGGGIILRWQITEWCNYRCSYCPQQHDRQAISASGARVHAFDNFPLEAWKDALCWHFKDARLSLTITGGEPLIDKENMSGLLTFVESAPFIECVRVDTNLSWPIRWYEALDKSKLILMCTFHPSQVEEAAFWSKVEKIIANGFRIGIINFVMAPGQISSFMEYRDKADTFGVVLHPNPLWGRESEYTEEERGLFGHELPDADFRFRSQAASPMGLDCLYPALAYEMDSSGNLTVGCHPERNGSLFGPRLPELFGSHSPCPCATCVCLDKYSFLRGFERNTSLNPLDDYRRALLRHRGGH